MEDCATTHPYDGQLGTASGPGLVELGLITLVNWRERAAFQRSAFGRSTAGNDVVATIFMPFWGPMAAILDFAGGAALQAVSKRPLRREAGIM